MTENNLQRDLGDNLFEALRKNQLTRREFLVRASVLGLSATFAGSVLAACGGGTSASTSPSAVASPKKGGTMRVAMVAPTAALDPVTMWDAGAIATVQQVCEYLAWVENDLTLRPVLAESWTPNDAADTWTFKVRSGVTFSSGQPLTADDVVATFKRLSDPKGGSAALSNFKDVLVPAGIRAVDAQTVEFGLEQAFVDFPYLVSSANYNAVVLPADYKGDFEKNAIGTGPFVLKSYAQKQGASFTRNPSYWQSGLPHLDGVELKYSVDLQAQSLQLQGGAVDMMLASPTQGSQALAVDPNIRIDIQNSPRIVTVAMRVDKTPFTEKGVRQAIAYSLDRPTILKAIFNGHGLPGADNFFCPLYPTSPQGIVREQDYAKAKQLLSDAGYANGVKITLVVEEYLEEPQLAQVMKQQCKPAGIDMTIQPMPQSRYYGGGSNGQAPPWLSVPMGVTGWAARPIAAQYFIPTMYSNGVWNSAHFKNAEFDSLGAKFTSTLDETSRKQIASDMVTLSMDETPYIIPYFSPAERAMKKTVGNVTASGTDYLDLTTAYLS
jgi:peptide/nickel transport system substrate-binding protein